MDPEQLKAMISEMLPNQDELLEKITNTILEQLPGLIKQLIAESTVTADADAEKPVVDAEAPPEEEENLDERLDSRLEAIRLFEKVTGESADWKNQTDVQLLQAAAKHSKLELRADAGRERLLGALEVSLKIKPKQTKTGDITPTSDVVAIKTQADYAAAYNARLGVTG